MKPADVSDLWWRTAVVYCLDVETFQDSDGDGIGDFPGLSSRIEHLVELGVTCVWLLPFHPSPNRDDGYDISDHYGVDPRLGTAGDVVEFLRIAHDRGIRVIMDLVLNHTSGRHPWFRSARRSPDSPFRDYYVWSHDPPRAGRHPVFPGEEDDVWTFDEKAGQYYHHSFHRFQPDLNLAHAAVRAEFARIVGYWLELGVDGFRLDAVPFLIGPPGAADHADPHAFLRELRRFIARRRGDAVLLGEVGLSHADQVEYFGTRGTELDLQFDFDTMTATFLALARREAEPLRAILGSRPLVDASQGWAMFLRNHDELTVELREPDEREDVFAAFAPDERQRVYDRGITRRLAPLLDGDPRRLRLAYSLLFSAPGAPVLLYGEEIGMGEIPRTPDRLAVRTPMQWTAEPAAGFSTARRSRLVRRLPDDGYAPRHVSVQEQQNDPGSLLAFVRRLIARYRATPEIAWGRTEVLPADDPAVFSHAQIDDDRVFLAVHNLSESACSVRVDLRSLPPHGPLRDILGTGAPAADAEERTMTIDLDAYGFRWFLGDRGQG